MNHGNMIRYQPGDALQRNTPKTMPRVINLLAPPAPPQWQQHIQLSQLKSNAETLAILQ